MSGAAKSGSGSSDAKIITSTSDSVTPKGVKSAAEVEVEELRRQLAASQAKVEKMSAEISEASTASSSAAGSPCKARRTISSSSRSSSGSVDMAELKKATGLKGVPQMKPMSEFFFALPCMFPCGLP